VNDMSVIINALKGRDCVVGALSLVIAADFAKRLTGTVGSTKNSAESTRRRGEQCGWIYLRYIQIESIM